MLSTTRLHNMGKLTLYTFFRIFSLISTSKQTTAIGMVVLPSILLAGFLTPLLVSPAYSAPAQIIFDTDMNGDCDDAGTLAMLHTLQDLGECNILAITTSWGGEVIPGAIDAINTYYGHPDIPVGSCKWWDGKTNAGEFMTYYSLVVPESGRYTLNVRLASENTDFSLDLLSSTGVKPATVAVGTTGGWQSWVTKTGEPFALPKGPLTFRVASTGGKWNLNWLEFKRVGPSESD